MSLLLSLLAAQNFIKWPIFDVESYDHFTSFGIKLETNHSRKHVVSIPTNQTQIGPNPTGANLKSIFESRKIIIKDVI